MFRQRLKGGHRVGSAANPGTVPAQNVNVGASPVYQTSNTGTHSYSAFDSSAGRSWNSESNTSNYQNQASLNDPKPFQATHNVAQFQNGANAQSQGYDEWNWGNEDSWNDWGNNDMSSLNTNNNFNQHQHAFNSQQQTFNTEQNTLMHGSEDQYVVPTVSGQQNAVVSEQQITTSMPNTIENVNAGSHLRVDYSSKGNVLSQQTSQPSILNQTSQGQGVSSNCNTYSVEDDPFHKNMYLDSSSVTKSKVNISHNMMQLQHQELHQPDNSTSLDSHNSSKNIIGNYFNSSKHEVSSNMYEYNPNDIQSNFVADDISSSNNNYERYPSVDHSGNGNETMLDSYKSDADKLKIDSKSNFWSGAFADESSAPVNEIHGEQDINKTPYNYVQDPHSVEKFHSGTFETNNFPSLPVNNCSNSVNQDISSVTDDAQNENESSAQPISSWDDEWGDGWEIKPSDSQTMDLPTGEHIPATEVSIMNYDNFYKNESDPYNYAVDYNWAAEFSRNEEEITNNESIPEIENTQRTKNESIPEIENTQRTKKESISEVSILRVETDSFSEAADFQRIESDSISEYVDLQRTNSESISEVAEDPQRIKHESISEAIVSQRTKNESASEAAGFQSTESESVSEAAGFQRTESESVSEAAGPQRTESESVSEAANFQRSKSESVSEAASFQRTKSESISEVANIQVLDQELQGIFSSPSEAASVINTDSCEYFEKRFPSSHSLQDDIANTNKLSEHLLNMHVEANAAEREDNVNFRDDNINSIMAMEGAEISDLENVNVAQTFTENSSSESPLSMKPLNEVEISSVNTNEIEDEAPYGDKFTDRNPNAMNSNSIPSTPPIGPAGSIPNFHARKGSPFQPPISRRSVPPQQQFNVFSNIQRFSPDIIKDKEDFDTPEGNPILSNIQPLEQNVKLCVVERPFHLASQMDYSENKQNNRALDFPGMIKSEPVDSYNDDIPPAHLSSMQLKFNKPKVRTLETMDDTPTSSSVLDLSHYSVQNEDREPPSFKRMVPGESSKGESTAASSYQIPIIVPAMPSGRVVTGNANPQPVPSVRIKQEPNEIRAPPDGPDTGAMRAESPGVIPPIRSETIGSEDHEVRLPRSDRRDDNRLGEREREKDNQRDYYSDRRKEGGYYANDSSHRMKPRERNYDSFYGERRYGRRTTYDDVDDEDNDIDDDERKFSEGIRERRRRAYQDEMERYSERDRNLNIEKRRTRNRDARYSHEDEDLYYEDPSSDRSRPSSRSSSFGHVESEPGHVSHSSHIDEYYDRGPKGGDRYRDKGSRGDPYRDYSQYKKRDVKERDPYGRAALNPYHDQRYGSRDMYDSQTYYYYCQQNYQKYLEQHPYYREYYRQYYGRYGYMAGGGEPPVVDDKASTRSGRSSINEEIKKSSLSSHFPQDFVDQSSVSAYESSIYPEQYSFNCKSFASGDVSRVPSVADEAETQHRMSPQLYTGPHLRASFTSGGKLLLVLPNDPKEGEKATVQLRNVQKMLAVDSAFETRIKKLSVYPGPLTIKETHKDVVLRFCEEQAIQAMKCDSLHDKDSVVLMWNYLSLLVKQNGNVCGADLANLLIKGRSVSNSSEREPNSEEKPSIDHGDGAEDESKLNMQMQQMFVSDQAELIKKFTELLCLGRKKEAVDYAIRENLWGYAMMLAAKMDSITHAKVMTSFMQTIPGTDVLQTLMQHLSNKKPEVSRNYSAEKWGDWRHHLAMMVSNPTGNVMKDRASIVALGDALASKHRYYAAHLCYLAADVEWGIFSNKDSKLVLIGSSPLQPFQSFASDDAIQCTEIFEFAKALDSNNPIFFKFQSYKLIYGYRLAEFGFPNEALRYCQVIAEAVIKQTDLFHVDFVAKVFELASQLKYYDVHYQLGEGEVSDMPDPDWLQYLDHTLQTLQYKAREELMQSAAAAEPAVREPEAYSAPESDYKLSSRRNSDLNRAISRSSDYANQVLHEPLDQPIEHSTFVEPTSNSIQQDHSQSVPYYSSGTTPHMDNKEITNDRLQYHNSPSVPTAEPQPDFGSGVNASTYTSPNETYSQQVSPNVVESPEGHASYPHEHQNQQQMPWQPQPEIPVYQQEPNAMHSYQMPQSNNQVFQSEPVHGLPQQYNSESSSNTSPVDHSTTPQMTAEEQEYYKMLSGKSKEASKSSGDSVDGTIKHEDGTKQSNENNMKDDDKKSSGFLGSLFGGWRKGNNQAKLPDDKNPTIVWDDKKKKWVNKDGDDSDEVVPPPPPSTIMSQPPPSNLRGGIKKSRYVDPVGDKGRTKTPIHSIPPPLPAMGVMPAVSKIAASPEKPMDGFREAPQPFAGYPETPLPASQPQENQNMIRRERFASSSSSVELYDDLACESFQGTDPPNAIPMMNPVEPQQQPLFFNPAQFQTPQSASSKPAKRAGPAKRSYNPQR